MGPVVTFMSECLHLLSRSIHICLLLLYTLNGKITPKTIPESGTTFTATKQSRSCGTKHQRSNCMNHQFNCSTTQWYQFLLLFDVCVESFDSLASIVKYDWLSGLWLDPRCGATSGKAAQHCQKNLDSVASVGKSKHLRPV